MQEGLYCPGALSKQLPLCWAKPGLEQPFWSGWCCAIAHLSNNRHKKEDLRGYFPLLTPGIGDELVPDLESCCSITSTCMYWECVFSANFQLKVTETFLFQQKSPPRRGSFCSFLPLFSREKISLQEFAFPSHWELAQLPVLPSPGCLEAINTLCTTNLPPTSTQRWA